MFANYMFGLPTETKEEMRQTVKMMQRIKPEMYSPAIFTPAPGSDLYTFCEEHDLNIIDSSAGYRRSHDSGAKIRGVDYLFVQRMVFESVRGPVKGKIGWLTFRLRSVISGWRNSRNL